MVGRCASLFEDAIFHAIFYMIILETRPACVQPAISFG